MSLINPLKICTALAFLFYAVTALAHTSGQGFVLLLPTNIYISSGVIAVALTILVLAIIPTRVSASILNSKTLFHLPKTPSITLVTSLASLLILIMLLVIGFTGSHDPLKNMLPLYIWTIWWIGFVCLQSVCGNLWHWINPWTGIYTLLTRTRKTHNPPLTLPESVGVWPALIIYIIFSCFALADAAPEDPLRLATVVTGYWIFTLIGMLLCGGSAWLQQCECFTVLLKQVARLSVMMHDQGKVSVGIPGWKLLRSPITCYSMAFFVLTLLAIGSFDGLNETFYWLGKLGINPLNFPGRSAVISQTISGIIISVVSLIFCFAICVWCGVFLANYHTANKVTFTDSFTQLSVSILPIALAYHFAHFFTAFLVNAQYALKTTTDPLQNGSDLLGLGQFYVTTGFFYTQSTVKIIWLTQAIAVVIGHVLSVVLAHTIALHLWKDPKRALLSQLPLSMFMILYTLLGLWLLAAPRGA